MPHKTDTTPKIRVYELAKQLKISNKEAISYLDQLNIKVKSHSSSVDADLTEKVAALRPQKEQPVIVPTSEPARTDAGVVQPPRSNKPSAIAKAQPKAPKADAVAGRPVASAQRPSAPDARPAQRPAPQRTAPQQDRLAAPAEEAPPTRRAQPVVHRNTARPPQQRSGGNNGGGRGQQGGNNQGGGHKGPFTPHPGASAASQPKKSAAYYKGRSQAEAVVEEVPLGPIVFEGPLTVRDLATLLRKRETDIIKHLFMKGIMVSINHTLDMDAMLNVAEAMEVEASIAKKQNMTEVEVVNVLAMNNEDSHEAHWELRSPVVSIMGHVDHGKTSLLDAIRETRRKIVDSEAGGITQSIGAYSVEKEDGKRIVFLDTPGHEAFTAMRMRGAKATDIAILVVAADDGVMPQTIEAINHAKAAGIPIIVAVNKIDKPAADPDRVLTQLMEHNVMSEKWGGDVITVEVSALQRLGLEDLLDNILLLAELMNLKADATSAAEGVIIEARLDKRQGPVATALVQKGTLRVGDNLISASVGGRVRSLISDVGERLKEAGPSTPVEITGLTEVPKAGAPFRIVNNNATFKAELTAAQQEERERRLADRGRSAGGLTRSLDDENRKELRMVLKADTQGSLEAAHKALEDLGTDEIQVNILHTGTGDITEADVMLATASQALVFGFNAREDANAARIAEAEGIGLYFFDIIYHMVEKVEKLMLGELDAVLHENEVGRAEIRQIITVGKNKIAGCMVTEGKIIRNSKAQVFRGKTLLFEGYLDTLKRFKDDAKEVAQGYECGISFSKFNEFQEGDIIVSTVQEERERTSL